MNGKEKIVPPD